MEKRRLGKTGLDVSLLGFGCGAVGGLMVGGAPADQERAVTRALELGVNYFDTAAQYGQGRSEENLGRVIKSLKIDDIYVGTKVRLPASTEPGGIGDGITAALEASLARLQLERVDLYQVHNAIAGATAGANVRLVESMLEEVVPAFERLVQQGKIGHYGITAVGETASLLRVVDARAFATAQVSFNLLNPSPGAAVPKGFPAQDYGGLLAHTKAANMGVINIRVLAGGALRRQRGAPCQRLAAARPDRFRQQLQGRSRTRPAADAAGQRRPRRQPRRGLAALRHRQRRGLDGADRHRNARTVRRLPARSINKGPLSPAALARVAEIQASFTGEVR